MDDAAAKIRTANGKHIWVMPTEIFPKRSFCYKGYFCTCKIFCTHQSECINLFMPVAYKMVKSKCHEHLKKSLGVFILFIYLFIFFWGGCVFFQTAT